MRVMVLVKATADSESGAMPSTEMLTEMGRYNEQLVVGALLQGGAWAPLFASRYVAGRPLDGVAARLPLPPGAFETSLWLRKR